MFPKKPSSLTEDVRFRLTGKKDRNGDPYYTGFSTAPIHLDMSNTVFFFFLDPDEEGDPDQFGGELVIRYRKEKEEELRFIRYRKDRDDT